MASFRKPVSLGVLAFVLLTGVAARAADAGGEPSRGVTLAADALVRDPRLVLLAGQAFDPREKLPAAAGGLAELEGAASVTPPGAVPDEVIRLVQAGDVGAAELGRRLAAAGIEVLSFVPNAAFVVRLPESWLPKLRSTPGVRFEGEYRSAWKADAALADAVLSDDAGLRGAPTRLHVAFMAGASADLHRELLESLGGAKVLSVETDPGLPQAVLEIAPGALRAAVTGLAAMRDVLRVDLYPVPRPDLDDAVWYVQTGNDVVRATDYDVSATLFARGITGRGVLVGLIDDGLENDHCQFTYGGATDEAAWPVGPSADAPNAVPDEGGVLGAGPPPVRTRDRRVVAYYVENGSSPYSSLMQHGTMVAETILGDHPSVLAARPLIRDIGDGQNVFPRDPSGDWLVGEQLRPDLLPLVDDPSADDPAFPNTHGARIEHHQAGDGIAPGAQLVFLDIGDAGGNLVTTVTMNRMLRQARRTGATVVTTAFSQDGCVGCYRSDAQAVDQAAWSMRDLVVVSAAGNDGDLGPGTIGGGIPQAKSAITAGATGPASATSTGTVRLGEDVMSFSALGPSTGGRLSPEIMAPGVVRARVTQDTPVDPEDGTGSGDFGCGSVPTVTIAGTSFSAGVMGGAAALVQQYFLDGFYPTGAPAAQDALRPTNALVRAILVNSARDLGGARTDDTHAGQAHRPSFGQGWGSPRLDDTLYFAGDPRRPTVSERARLVVLNDVPNGFDGAFPLTNEPGGRTRDRILPSFHPALADGGVHEYFVNVENADPTDPANELRITLAWSDAAGTTDAAPLTNNLDLEVVSPGPDGILQTTSSLLGGDDVVYRPNPQVAWSGGYTQPSLTRAITPATSPAGVSFADRDAVNTVENVFVSATDVAAGTWRVRVIGLRVPAPGGTNDGMPNFALNDTPPTIDTDGDGVPDLDDRDAIFADRQGYALIASGGIIVPATRFTPRVPRTPRGPREPRPPSR